MSATSSTAGSETFDYLVALNRFRPGATLFDAAADIHNPSRPADGPLVADDQRPLIAAGVDWLAGQFSGHTPVNAFAPMASWETGQKLLVPALGRLVLAPAAALSDGGSVEIAPQEVSLGDLLILQCVFILSPATATTGAVCHSSDPTLQVVAVGGGPIWDTPAERSEPYTGGYLVLVRPARPGTSRVSVVFLRVTGAGVRVGCDVTVRE